jgi:hypothetical protein
MGKINAEWHKNNKMPKNASLEEKIKWHAGHARNCACRDSRIHLLKLREIKNG